MSIRFAGVGIKTFCDQVDPFGWFVGEDFF